jgi:hypothetical protein
MKVQISRRSTEFRANGKQSPKTQLVIKRLSEEMLKPDPVESLYIHKLDRTRKEIRVLSFGSHDGSQSSYKLDTVSLLDNPRFYALSYVWGDPTDTTSIIVSGVEIPITKALNAALARLRQFVGNNKQAFGVWADAICIDQRDDSDKSYQIPLMRDLYSKAHRVIAWLGSSAASDELLELYRQIVPMVNGGSSADMKQTLDNALVLKVAMALYEPNPFWSRIWIVQELCLPTQSPVLLSNHNSILLDELLDVHNWYVHKVVAKEITELSPILLRNLGLRPIGLGDLDEVLMVNSDRLEQLRFVRRGIANSRESGDAFESTTSPLLMVYTAQLMRSRKASNPSDHLYGMLGLTEPLRKRIPVDYRLHHLDAFKPYFSMLWTSIWPVILQDFDFSWHHDSHPSWIADVSKRAIPSSLACGRALILASRSFSGLSATKHESAATQRSYRSVLHPSAPLFLAPIPCLTPSTCFRPFFLRHSQRPDTCNQNIALSSEQCLTTSTSSTYSCRITPRR